MNTSEEYQFIYFDDNSTTSVENDEDSLLSNGVTVTQVILCLLFCLSLLGMFKKAWIWKNQQTHIITYILCKHAAETDKFMYQLDMQFSVIQFVSGKKYD